MTAHEFVKDWLPFIIEPYVVNAKQGFVLANGVRILFSDTKLDRFQASRLRAHYQKLNKVSIL
jgi:hypothetical protein|tara:strand:+ start:787 stop:975 length:189 start_codon:yes stop_codon:yes gene_type:complete